ncbi:hypothetical protein [Flavobacterium sp.]|uniref:hypothetical protein n=1 Tax=Flavobacterium sp. TaxID=239 RepID=UPI004047ADB6
MTLLFKIVLSVVAAFIVILSYFAIKDVNVSRDLSTNEKRQWVFFILYLPVIGSLYYFLKKKTN